MPHLTRAVFTGNRCTSRRADAIVATFLKSAEAPLQCLQDLSAQVMKITAQVSDQDVLRMRTQLRDVSASCSHHRQNKCSYR